MHIVFICSELPPAPFGGVGSFVSSIAPRIQELGHKVTVLGAYGREYAFDERLHVVDVLRRPSRSRRSFSRRVLRRLGSLLRLEPRREVSEKERMPEWFWQQLKELHRRDRVDVVEWHSNQGLFHRPIRGIVDVVRLHGSHVSISKTGAPVAHWEQVREQRTMQGIPNWVGVSQWSVDELKGLFACSPKRVRVIYNPVDCTLFHPASHRAEGQSVLFVGTLEDRKGDLVLAESANQFLRTFPDCRLLFVGRHTEARKCSLIEVVHESLRCRVEVRPALPREEVAEMMRQAAVFSMPSSWESFGMVYAEAMASGVPVVACDCTGVPEVVPHEVAGLLVAPGDAMALGKAIERLLRDPDLRQLFGRNGRALAVERFGLEQCVSSTLAFYENCLNET